MTLQLEELSSERYAEHVLPLTEPLWGHGRTLETYRQQTIELAQTAYGRTSYRTIALSDGANIFATFKRYERDARVDKERLRAIGIGAVFTPEPYRGQGFASAMLAMALDQARAGGIDFAFLFSDIHPQFYKSIGFSEVPSRTISFRADSLEPGRIDALPLVERDWAGIRTCFEATQAQTTFGLTRSPAVWNWIRVRMEHVARQTHVQPVNLTVRRGRSIAVYLLGRRKPLADSYVIDEFGFIDAAAGTLAPALLRFAAGDLRRIVGWLPPAPARSVLPRGAVRKRSEAIWMIAPLTASGARFMQAAQESGSADGIWALDHI
jgi:GNAT superfamily N-acetyltransferase